MLQRKGKNLQSYLFSISVQRKVIDRGVFRIIVKKRFDAASLFCTHLEEFGIFCVVLSRVLQRVVQANGFFLRDKSAQQ